MNPIGELKPCRLYSQNVYQWWTPDARQAIMRAIFLDANCLKSPSNNHRMSMATWGHINNAEWGAARSPAWNVGWLGSRQNACGHAHPRRAQSAQQGWCSPMKKIYA